MLTNLEESFSLLVGSSKSTNVFDNDSSTFRNLLGRSIDLSEYSVSLRAIHYYDKFFAPPTWERLIVEPKPLDFQTFFKNKEVDSAFELNKLVSMRLEVDNTNKTTLPMFTSYLNEQFMQYDVGATIILTVNQYTAPTNPLLEDAEPTIITEYKQAKIINHDLHEFDFAIPKQIARMYGFSKNVFSVGEHYSNLPVAPELYNAFAPNSVWTIYKMQRIIEKHEIPQLREATVNDVMLWLSVAVMNVGGLLTFNIDEENLTLEYRLRPKDSTLKLSEFLSNYLGLDPDSVISGHNTIPITAQMLDPYGQNYKSRADYLKEASLSKFFVLTNCVDNTLLYDGKFFPCIAIIQREEGQPKKVYRPKKLTHYPATKSPLDQIEIKLVTDKGLPLPVTENLTTVELYFQKLL